MYIAYRFAPACVVFVITNTNTCHRICIIEICAFLGNLELLTTSKEHGGCIKLYLKIRVVSFTDCSNLKTVK